MRGLSPLFFIPLENLIFRQNCVIINIENNNRSINMLITPEVLRDHGACQVYIDFFAKRYPNGI